MWHQHGGKLFRLERVEDDWFANVQYGKWVCSGCRGITLIESNLISENA